MTTYSSKIRKLDRAKKTAKKLAKIEKISHCQALDLHSKNKGFLNWHHLKKIILSSQPQKLKTESPSRFESKIKESLDGFKLSEVSYSLEMIALIKSLSLQSNSKRPPQKVINYLSYLKRKIRYEISIGYRNPETWLKQLKEYINTENENKNIHLTTSDDLEAAR